MTVPAPPRPLTTPIIEVVPAGTILFRAHALTLSHATNPGNVFNPGIGARTRFAFFGDPTVPVLYAGQNPETAVFESVFHNTMPGSVVTSPDWQTKVVTALRVNRDLTLAVFHSAGLRRYDLHARDLTDTPAETCGDTVAWAEAIHADATATTGDSVVGMVWMSRQFNTDRAYVFFGDRVTDTDLTPVDGHPGSRDFLVPDDAEWVRALADRINVTLLG